MSGFVDLVLARSGNKITVSRTAILFIEESLSEHNFTHLHCVGGITHVVVGAYHEIAEKFPKFFPTSRSDSDSDSDSKIRVSINDWNLSYIEKAGETTLVYFTERGITVPVTHSYEEITKYFHSLE
ncbi:hypothetical protein [Actinobacillus pleuropneumoniae]|uniref:hypothetical protein n=1 Tax=Actinobacillus pleuropneumoniae TaxID=715 RepID=UPI000045D844|nr:hypothetical protein [Actinobacillus pleuropneumoniae]MCL7724439.1 hypothetical protein [Actinobacillus pleuropneumoniae]MCL7737129.1 hypothetical protein [Actinobacillus pleuropneumoniae]MEE3617949.1 hypothetical protein [Actinobacillus pleuropneumoniae]UKH11013.1 hypothetical protein D1098_03535 [Actinobacillus pleuropneumoniae]UKH18327.1 hypothetical protein D1110_04110 [Actinobacillus pleuropneumoniae]